MESRLARPFSPLADGSRGNVTEVYACEPSLPGASKRNAMPPYGRRSGFVPRRPEDYGDGGSYPEVHVAQYPLGMGRGNEKAGSNILALTVDARGGVAFDAVVRQGENAFKIVYSKYNDLVPKITADEEGAEETEEQATARTSAALGKIIDARLAAAQPANVPTRHAETKVIKYTPSRQSAEFNSGAKERVVSMAETQADPLEPLKFKHKQVPAAAGPPPVPVMHSPPRPATVKDHQDWTIPPCISNWKNLKGYSIPLEMRLAADGRGLHEVQVNDGFARLSESLYAAEQKSREAVQMRSKMLNEMLLKAKAQKEQELRELAQQARLDMTGVAPAPPGASVGVGADMETREETAARMERDRIREDRRRERENERRLEARGGVMGKKSKLTRDDDRDVTEKIALGMASTTGGAKAGEVMYDQRLFNQDKGMDSGFGAADEQYNVYSNGLFAAASPTLSTLYRPRKDGEEKKGRPVEFDQDPFGLDRFLADVKRAKKHVEV